MMIQVSIDETKGASKK